MAKKKKKGGSASNRMTSAERTRAKMRAQEQARAERAEAEVAAVEREATKDAASKQEAAVPSAAAEPSVQSEVDDIDAQIAALQQRKAQLEGADKGESRDEAGARRQNGGPDGSGPKTSSKAKGKQAKASASEPKRSKQGKAASRDEGEDSRRRPQAYPGEDKLRRAQGKLEQQAAKWDANPTVNRVVCAAIDFVVGAVLLMGPAALPYYYLSGTASMTSLTDYVTLGYPVWLPTVLAVVGLVLGFFYYVIVPWKIWPGQTLGKHLGHIRIVRRDRRELDFWTIFLRQFVGVMFLELGLTCDMLLIPQLITLLTGSSDAGTTFQSVGITITVVSIVLFSANKRRLALHDRFAGTRVE